MLSSATNLFRNGNIAHHRNGGMARFQVAKASRVFGTVDRSGKVIDHHHDIFWPSGTMVEAMIQYGRADDGPDCDGRSVI